jgi:hypothetical protein
MLACKLGTDPADGAAADDGQADAVSVHDRSSSDGTGLLPEHGGRTVRPMCRIPSPESHRITAPVAEAVETESARRAFDHASYRNMRGYVSAT